MHNYDVHILHLHAVMVASLVKPYRLWPHYANISEGLAL